MIEYAPERRCPFFLICRDTIQVPASDRAVIIPVYNCNLVASGMTPHDGQPHVAYGPDGGPVCPQACTQQRYETECKSCMKDTVAPRETGQQILLEAQHLIQQSIKLCSRASAASQRARYSYGRRAYAAI